MVFFRVLLLRTVALGSVFARWGRWFFLRFVSKNSVIGLSVCLVGRCFFSRFVIKNSVIGLSVRLVWAVVFFFAFC